MIQHSNWQRTSLTTKLNIDFPIIQAPMAGATTPELIAAISNAGGLGSLGAGYLAADDIQKNIRSIRRLTNKPFAVNLFIPENVDVTIEQLKTMRTIILKLCPELALKDIAIEPPYSPNFDDQLQIIIDENVPVFSFTFGVPADHWLKILKSKGIILMGTATNVDEALLLQEKHIDFVIAQGSEAGGHRGTFLHHVADSLFDLKTLIHAIAQKISTPIVAAGGIMTAEDINEILALNVSGVQMGTAFLTADESSIHTNYKQQLLSATEDTTVLTRAFSGRFARGLHNEFIKRMIPYDTAILPYPVQNALTRPMRQAAALRGDIGFMSLWAGTKAYLCQKQSAKVFINQLIERLHKF